jgi:hypothetical protein
MCCYFTPFIHLRMGPVTELSAVLGEKDQRHVTVIYLGTLQVDTFVNVLPATSIAVAVIV